MDLNEKEPLWALGGVLFLGALAGAGLPLLVASTTLALEDFRSSLWQELTKFGVLLLAVALFEGLSRLRGWSEINGLTDGIMYGAAVGLGFAAGEAFARELSFGGLTALVGVSRFDTLWTTALDGLSDGVFGAVLGAGFGVAAQARSTIERVASPVAALAGAILVHYVYLRVQGSEGGTSGEVRSWLALLLPLVFVVGLLLFSLAQERRTLRGTLADEVARGALSADELLLVHNPRRRRVESVQRLLAGDLDGWAALRTLHNRAVQLALVRRRAEREPDPHRRRAIEAEAGHLRAAIAGAHRQLAQTTQRSTVPESTLP